MLKIISKQKFVLLTFLIAFAVLFFFYHQVFLAPNDYLFSEGGDGIKNYYTYLYHAKNDLNFGEFTGMNYPYYEHVVYTDAHPLLSWLIGKLGLVNYGIGILNVLMLLSYPIAAAFIFKILRHYKVDIIWSILAAVVFAFLSPQVFRMGGGHYAMSYVFAVPIMFWLLIKYYATKKWIWSILIAIYLIAFFFTHPYLGIILAFFSIVFWLVQMVIDRKRIGSSLLQIIVQVVVPLAIFQGYIALTDTHIDRLSNPAGFFFYKASWNSLLVAHHGPLSPIFSYFDIRIGNWEAWAYIGAPTIIFALVIGFYILKKRKEIQFKSFLKQELNLFIITAYLILLFSFCFPLKYHWLRWITDIIGPLKQFRVLGRFTWVFYTVFTVACTVGIYKLYKKTNKIGYKLLFFFGIGFYFLEFFNLHIAVGKNITIAENKFNIETVNPNLVSVIDFVKEKEYDAFMFLPFNHMSSENIMILGDEDANFDSFILGYHANIPMLNSTSSRMSLAESITFANYFSPSFIEKELTYDFPKEDKIVIIKSRKVKKIKTAELNLIWQSELVYENEDYAVFNFDPKKWNSREGFDKVMAKKELANFDVGQGWKSDTNKVWFYYDGFNTVGTDLPANEKLGGEGAFKDTKKKWNTILSFDKEEIEPGNYVVKFWYYLRVDRPDVSGVVEEKFSNSDSVAWVTEFDVRQSNLIVEDWSLIEMEFTVAPEMEQLNILITGNGNEQPFIIDELLLQKQNDPPLFRETIKNGTPYIVYNNYWIKEKSFVK